MMKHKVIISAIIAVILVGIAGWYLLYKQNNLKGKTDYIKQKVIELNYDPAKIIAYVKNDIAKENYTGYLRGPVGTIWGESGNEIDKVYLLHKMLGYVKIENKLLSDGKTLDLKYKIGGEWNYYNANRNKLTAVEVIPESIIHKIEFQLIGVSNKKDEIELFKHVAVVADLVGEKCYLEVVSTKEGERRAELWIGDRKIGLGARHISEYRKIKMAFNVFSPSGEMRRFERVLSDADWETGHIKLEPGDVYMIAIQPGFIRPQIVKEETERLKLKLSVANRLYLLNLAHMSLSDEYARSLIREYGYKTYYITPRIIIAAREMENKTEGAIQNLTLDLLKDDIWTEDRNGDVLFSRGIGENMIEGRALSLFTQQESISTTTILNAMFANHRSQKTSLSKRYQSYLNMLENMSQSENTFKITLTYQNNVLVLRNDNNEKANQVEIVIPEKIIERLGKKRITKEGLQYNPEKKEYSLQAAIENKQAIVAMIETIFMEACGSPCDYIPHVNIEKMTSAGFRLANKTNLIGIKINADGNTAEVRMVLRGSKSNNYWEMEWVYKDRFGRTKVAVPHEEYSLHNFGWFGFNKDITNIKNLWIGRELFQKQQWPKEKMEVYVDGKKETLPVRRLDNYDYANSDYKIWVLDDIRYPLILKVEAKNYRHIVDKIIRSSDNRTIRGKITDAANGDPIENAKIQFGSGTAASTWLDGTYECPSGQNKPVLNKSILFILDDSGSMDDPLKSDPKGPSKKVMAKTAAEEIIDELIDEETEIYICNFNVYCGFTNIKEYLIGFIQKAPSSFSGTPLPSALENAIQAVKNKAIGKYASIVLLTDGESTEKERTMQDVYKQSGMTIPVFAIGFDLKGNEQAIKELREIAEISGGKYLMANNVQELKTAFKTLAEINIPQNQEAAIEAKGYEGKTVVLEDGQEEINIKLEPLRAMLNPDETRLAFITKNNLREIETLEIRRQSKEIIKSHLDKKPLLTMIVPKKVVNMSNMDVVGWWEYDSTNGDITGVTEDGLHGAGFIVGTIGGYVLKNGDVRSVGGMVDQTNALRGFASQLAGMYMGTAAVIDAALETGFNDMRFQSRDAWVEYIKKRAFALSEEFKAELNVVGINPEKYEKAVKSIIRLFETGSTQLLEGVFVDLLKDKMKPPWYVW